MRERLDEMADTQITAELWNEENEEYERVVLPARFKVCPDCRGRGGSSAYLGSFTRDEMDEMGEEFIDDYRAGRFDRPCPKCKGQRVISVVDKKECEPALYQRYKEQQEKQAQMDYEDYMERRTLGLMSGDSLRDWD